jgi:hypothetical protein
MNLTYTSKKAHAIYLMFTESSQWTFILSLKHCPGEIFLKSLKPEKTNKSLQVLQQMNG